MDQRSLTPSTQAVLDTLTKLGQGTLHELADKSGKARSTTDKAIKTLTEAGKIVAAETDADGTPTRWAIATSNPGADTGPDTRDPGDPHTSGADDAVADSNGNDANGGDTGQAGDANANHGDRDGDTDRAGAGEDSDDRAGSRSERGLVAVVQPTRPGDRRVMAIKGVVSDYGDDGATLDMIAAESGIAHATASRLLTAMEQADAARCLPGVPRRWVAGPTRASEVDPNPEPPRCPLCLQVIRAAMEAPAAVAAVTPLIRPDGTLHIVGTDGETHIVSLPARTPPRAQRSAAPAVRVGEAGVNADGSQPFARGELEKLTVEVLAAHPGRAMSPQDIATEIGQRLGRAVSGGAVRNNCTKAAAAGRIVMVSDAPLTFAAPAGTTGDADPDTTDQPGGAAE